MLSVNDSVKGSFLRNFYRNNGQNFYRADLMKSAVKPVATGCGCNKIGLLNPISDTGIPERAVRLVF